MEDKAATRADEPGSMNDREPIEPEFARGPQRMVEDFGGASRSAHPPLVVPDQPIERHDSGPTSPRSCRPKALILFHKVNGIAGPADRFGLAPSPHIGRAPCRERVCQYVSISVVALTLTQKPH